MINDRYCNRMNPECEIMLWDAEPTYDKAIRTAVVGYLTECGCTTKVASTWVDGGIVVRLPCARTEWQLRFSGGNVETTVFGQSVSRRVIKRTERAFDLSDPDSLPKLVDHLRQNTEFLRSGNNKPVPQVRAV